MTVTNENRSVTYDGDGSTTVFPVANNGVIYFLQPTDLLVTLIDAEGVDHVQALTTDYTVSGAGDADGGSVTMLTPPAAGERLRIERWVDILQPTNYPENTKFPAASHERALDRLTMIDQQLQAQVDRAPKFAVGSGLKDVQIAAPGTDRLLGWSSDGKSIIPTETTVDERTQRIEGDKAIASLIGQAGSIEVPVYDTALAVSFAKIKPTINSIRTGGYREAGDGGGALYKRVGSEPAHPGKIQSSDGAWWELAEERITPLMVGASRNSALDQTTAVQNWLDVLKARGAEGYVPAGVYRVDGELSTDQSGLRVECHRKAVFDASNAASSTFTMTISGTISAYANISVGNAQLGATRLRTTSTFAQTLALGDVIKVKSADIYDASSTGMSYGELNVVTGLVDAATGYVDVELPLSATYSTTPQVAKVAPVTDVEWRGGKFLGAVAEENDQKAFRLRYVKDFVLDGIQGERMDDRIFWIEDCMNGEVARPVGKDARPTSTGYGVSVMDATQDVTIHHGEFTRIRHSFSTNNQTGNGGIPRRITFADNKVSGGAFARGGSMGPGDAIDTHSAAEEIYIERNTVKGCPGQGINFEARSGAVRDNKVLQSIGNGISVHNESDLNGSITISGNRVVGVGARGIYLTNATRGASSFYESAVVTGNVVDGAATEAMRVNFSGALQKLRGLVISGNAFRGHTETGLYLFHVRGATIAGNEIDNGSNAGLGRVLRVLDSLDVVVSGNTLLQLHTTGVEAVLVSGSSGGSSSRLQFTGNRIGARDGTLAANAITLDNNVTQTGIYGNNLRTTNGVSLGTGTGNAEANNIV